MMLASLMILYAPMGNDYYEPTQHCALCNTLTIACWHSIGKYHIVYRQDNPLFADGVYVYIDRVSVYFDLYFKEPPAIPLTEERIEKLLMLK